MRTPNKATIELNMPAIKNDQITAPTVRVIGPDGEQLGVLPTSEAIKKARGFGMDLLEIAPNATPPVARIVDLKKYERKDKASKPPDCT